MRVLPKGSVKLFRTPVVRIFLALFLLGGVFVAGIVWSHLENVEQRRNYQAAIEQAGRLSAKNSQLEQESKTLKERITQLERKLQIDQVAYEKLTSTLNNSSEYISELRADLDFYQSIISPEDNQPGVKVHDLKINESPEGEEYNYKLTLVQALNHESLVRGEVNMALSAIRKDVPVTIEFAELGVPPGKLKFRYFQILTGQFNLPDGVTPQSIEVNLDVKSNNRKSHNEDRVFIWRTGKGTI